MIDLNTRDLLIVSMHQQGHTPTSIALDLSVGTDAVRRVLKSPKVIAYQLESEATTDVMLKNLYHGGVLVLEEALRSDSGELKLKAVKLIFEAIGKIRPKEAGESKTYNIQQILQVMNKPPTQAEIDAMQRYVPDDSPGVIDATEAIQAPAEDSE